MPNYRRRTADDPGPPPENVSELKKRLKQAAKERDQLRAERYAARMERRTADWEATGEPFQALLDEINDLERRVARLENPVGGDGQTVGVGTASEGEK